MKANEIIKLLDLKPHPGEGGYYRETYRSDEMIPASALPPRYKSGRQFSTAIYYLLTPNSFSALHRIPTDEIFHFYLGDPVAMFQIHPDSRGEEIILGNDLRAGQVPQSVVPRNVWQGSYLNEGGKFALLGTTVAPAFDFHDFEPGNRESLLKCYPQFEGIITRLTRNI